MTNATLPSPPTPTVGLVGLGEMGMPIARRLLAAGHAVRCFARRAAVAREAAGLGAVPVDSLADLGATSDLLVICVYSDAQAREVALGADGALAHLRSGSIVLNHTTGRPSTATTLLHAAEQRGATMLDCALSGGPQAIESGTLTLLVGGDAETLARARPVLASYSSPILHVGAVGDGQKVKLLNNALFGAQVAFAMRIDECARQFGMDPEPVLRAIHECSGDSYALAAAAAYGSAQKLIDAAGRFIRKDVAVCSEVLAEMGVDLESVLAVAHEV